MMLSKVPFFQKFRAMKNFKRWRYTARASAFRKAREKLSHNFIFSRPIFVERFMPIVDKINETRFLQFIEISAGVQYGKHQQFTLEERCQKCVKESKTKLDQLLSQIKVILENLKEEIELDDENYKKAIKQQRVNEMIKRVNQQASLVMFSKERKQLEEEQKQFHLAQHRRYIFNRLAQFVATYLTANLSEMIHTNKFEFRNIFCNLQSFTQFEVSMCFNQKGILDSDPSIEEHRATFTNIFEQMEDSIFKNQFLIFWMQDITELFFREPEIAVCPTAQMHLRRKIGKMQYELQQNKEYKRYSLDIKTQLEEDICQLQKNIE